MMILVFKAKFRGYESSGLPPTNELNKAPPPVENANLTNNL